MSSQAYLLELKTLLEHGKFEDVISRSKILSAELKNDPLVLNIVAAAFKAMGDLDGAIHLYKIAINTLPFEL